MFLLSKEKFISNFQEKILKSKKFKTIINTKNTINTNLGMASFRSSCFPYGLGCAQKAGVCGSVSTPPYVGYNGSKSFARGIKPWGPVSTFSFLQSGTVRETVLQCSSNRTRNASVLDFPKNVTLTSSLRGYTKDKSFYQTKRHLGQICLASSRFDAVKKKNIHKNSKYYYLILCRRNQFIDSQLVREEKLGSLNEPLVLEQNQTTNSAAYLQGASDRTNSRTFSYSHIERYSNKYGSLGSDFKTSKNNLVQSVELQQKVQSALLALPLTLTNSNLKNLTNTNYDLINDKLERQITVANDISSKNTIPKGIGDNFSMRLLNKDGQGRFRLYKSKMVKNDVKKKTDSLHGLFAFESNVNFFPYRKSFLCYWLLPLVGFVSAAVVSRQLSYKINTNIPPYKYSLTDGNKDYKNTDYVKTESNVGDSPFSINESESQISTSLLRSDPSFIRNSTSLKYCLYYLDCLQHSLISDFNQKNQVYFPKTLSLTTLQQNNVEREVFNFIKGGISNTVHGLSPEQLGRLSARGSESLQYSSSKTGFYPTAFFNRVVFDRQHQTLQPFLGEPLKLNINVPFKTNSQVAQNEKYAVFEQTLRDNSKPSSSTSLFSKMHTPESKYRKTLLDKPISSFILSSSKLDKYLIYEPFFKNIKLDNISINEWGHRTDLIDKLFSYFSSDFVDALNSQTHELTSSKDNLSTVFSDSLLGKKLSNIEFQKNTDLLGVTVTPKTSDNINNSELKIESILQVRPKSSRQKCDSIYSKYSKNKLYSIILGNLGNTLMDLEPSYHITNTLVNALESENSTTQSFQNKQEASAIGNTKTVIKLKYPILMTNTFLSEKAPVEGLYRTSFPTSSNSSIITLIDSQEGSKDNQNFQTDSILSTNGVFEKRHSYKRMLKTISQSTQSHRPIYHRNEILNTIQTLRVKLRPKISRQTEDNKHYFVKSSRKHKTDELKKDISSVKSVGRNPIKISTTLNNLTSYFLKDFLILNRISNSIEPIMDVDTIYSNNKKPLLSDPTSSKKSIVVNISQNRTKNKFDREFYSSNSPVNSSGKISLSAKNIRVHGPAAKYYSVVTNITPPNKSLFLTSNISSGSGSSLRQKNQSDKTTKLLRAYVSIKKDYNGKKTLKHNGTFNKTFRDSLNVKVGGFGQFSKDTVSGTKKLSSLSRLHDRLKHKLIYNLISNSWNWQQNQKNGLSAKFDGDSSNTAPVYLKAAVNTNHDLQDKANKSIQSFSSQKGFNLSPKILLNNRLFMKLNNENVSSVQHFNPGEDVVKKRKVIQKQRRITKLKKETRRRKKRMRFYPRPSWLRYRFYAQFLKSRRHTDLPLTKKREISLSNNLNYVNFANSPKQHVKPRNKQSFEYFYSQQKLNKNLIKKGVKNFPYLPGGSSIDISSAIMNDLKTSFWKSYWLRSNLKPYLEKIKMSLKDIKTLSVEQDSTVNLQPILNRTFEKNDVESYYKTANLLSQYNQITAQRIKQFASQIRENLTLNGNFKVRPSRITMNFTQSAKNYKKSGIPFVKSTPSTLRYDALSRLRLYWALSKGGTNLVMSDTSGYPPGIKNLNASYYNKRKQLWTTEKYRQQIKENKTKKVYNDLKTKIQSLLLDTPYLVQTPIRISSQDKSYTTAPRLRQALLKSLNKTQIQEQKLSNLSYFNKDKIFKSPANVSSLETRRDGLGISSSLKNFNLGNGFDETAQFRKNARVLPIQNLRVGPKLRPKSSREQYNLRQLKIRNNRLKKKFSQTAQSQPFISGKISYWWTQFNPTNFYGIGSFIYNAEQNKIGTLNMFGNPVQNIHQQYSGPVKKGWSNLVNTSNNDSYGIVNSPADFTDKRDTFLVQNESNFVSQKSLPYMLQVNSLLFHFCSLITLLSISQIRGLLKFLFIGLTKVFVLVDRIVPSYFYVPPLRVRMRPKALSSRPIGSLSNNSSNRSFGFGAGAIFSSQNSFSGQNIIEPYSTVKKLSDLNKFFITRNNQKMTNPSAYLGNKMFDLDKRNDSFIYSFYGALGLQNKNLNNSSVLNESRSRSRQFLTGSLFNARLVLDEKFSSTSTNQNKIDLQPRDSLRVYQTGIYSIVNFCLKIPILFYYNCLYNFGRTKSLKSSVWTKGSSDFPTSSILQNTENSLDINRLSVKSSERRGSVLQKVETIDLVKSNVLLFSLVFSKNSLKTLFFLSNNFTNLFGQRTKLESSFRSIYSFFEKPGVLIVDWVAYLFLVEWASDITNTIPESYETLLIGSPFTKFTRLLYSMGTVIPLEQQITNSVLLNNTANSSSITNFGNSQFGSQVLFFTLASTFLRRRIYHLYELFLFQFFQPDTDLLVRQRKGIVFWDIWGDFLNQTAEDSNINISELTSLKEEQMKLLENVQNTSIQGENLNPLGNKAWKRVARKGTKERLGSQRETSVSVLAQKPNASQVSDTDVVNNTSRSLKTSPNTFNSDRKNILYSPNSFVTSVKTRAQENNPYRLGGKSDVNGGEHSGLSLDSQITPSLKEHTLTIDYRPFERISSNSFFGVPFEPIRKTDSSLHQWGAQQFLSYAIKSKDTELFIDLHPPRSLTSILQNRNNESSQQLRALSPMGGAALVCQIFSGLLSKQISKNILIVGNSVQKSNLAGSGLQTSSSNQSLQVTEGRSQYASHDKSLLVQAIAGETELKIITDNAYRYAIIHRGVAVGIKLLRDVFDSLSLQTPCFFLLEDIHAIGERRPFLISDDTPEGEQNNEIHEKNQVLYQLSKHVISNYKKPYKGDFSLSIPTNHFCFEFFKNKNGNNVQIGKASTARKNTVSPKISYSENSTEESNNKSTEPPRLLGTRLRRSSTELLSPPATSPFSVLTLKEEKKLKTHKKVSDLSWTGKTSSISQEGGGSSNSQDSLKIGPAYSTRAKVALLADMAISSLSVKLDMITDLLVIIDSVKGNRGFVVFATTDIPFVLDPALRRPGRLDETISFGFSSKTHSFEVSHLGILNLPSSSAMGSASYFTSIPGLKNTAFIGKKGGSSLDLNLTSTQLDNNTILSRLSKACLQTYPYSNTNYSKKTTSLFHSFSNNLFSRSSLYDLGDDVSTQPSNHSILTSSMPSTDLANKSSVFVVKPPKTSDILSQAATKASAYLNTSLKSIQTISPQSLFHTNSLKPVKPVSGSNTGLGNTRTVPNDIAGYTSTLHMEQKPQFDFYINNSLAQLPDYSNESAFSNTAYLNLYSSSRFLKYNLSLLISGKIGEFLRFSKTSKLEQTHLHSNSTLNNNLNSPKIDHSERTVTINNVNHYASIQNPIGVSSRRLSLLPVINESISSFVLSFVQKRFLYNKNLMLPTLFNLTNYSSLMEFPSPPLSSILLPAKRYENLKRSSFYYQNASQNLGSGIMEKINLHQQQRLVKRLYNVPVKESFQSEIIENRLSGFSSASLTIGNISPSLLQKPSSSNWFVRNRIFARHSNHLTNQWWTGQLPEHNAETTFLSDIDWRYTFVQSEARDILLDFPDADQHYNPRNRRWINNRKNMFNTVGINSLTSSETSFNSEIYSHFIYDSFLKAFNIYEQNRETFDYYVFYVSKQGLHSHLNDFERLKLIQRFLQN